VHHFCMILEVHFSCQGNVAPGIGACYRLTVRMVAEMLAMEVLFEVAVTGESPQAFSCR